MAMVSGATGPSDGSPVRIVCIRSVAARVRRAGDATPYQ
jgi:hypothetical protein